MRDYDFSVLLPEYNAQRAEFSTPDNFGDLHGKLFQQFANSSAYKERFSKPPVICISASTSKTYRRTGNKHPVLGVEYQQNELSSTDQYFAKWGCRFGFHAPNGVAPLAFYFHGDLLGDYTNLELIGTISTMETFQKIYRPEIYNANSAAGNLYQPSLKNQDYSLTQIVYDREERSQLAVKQGNLPRSTSSSHTRASLNDGLPISRSDRPAYIGHSSGISSAQRAGANIAAGGTRIGAACRPASHHTPSRGCSGRTVPKYVCHTHLS